MSKKPTRLPPFPKKRPIGLLPDETLLQLCERMDVGTLINFLRADKRNYRVCKEVYDRKSAVVDDILQGIATPAEVKAAGLKKFAVRFWLANGDILSDDFRKAALPLLIDEKIDWEEGGDYGRPIQVVIAMSLAFFEEYLDDPKQRRRIRRYYKYIKEEWGADWSM